MALSRAIVPVPVDHRYHVLVVGFLIRAVVHTGPYFG